MPNTVVQQPKQQGAAPAPAAAQHAPAASNDRAATAAVVERRRKSAAAVPQPWRTALGGLFPTDALGASAKIAIVPPTAADFHRATYRLAVTATAGFEQAQQYLVDAGIDKAFQDALRAVGQVATADRAPLGEIRAAIVAVTAGDGGDLGQASMHLVRALAVTSEDAKQYLRHDENGILDPLHAFLANASHFPNPQSDATKAKRAAFEGLYNAAHTAQATAAALPGSAPAAAAGYTPAQVEAGNKLIGAITTQFPPGAPGQVVTAKASPKEMDTLRAEIDHADPRVRDYVYAWRGKDGRGVLQLLSGHLAGGQVQAVSQQLDGVERLYHDLEALGDTQADGPSAQHAVHAFLAAHLGDKETRDRVLANAPLMQRHINRFPDAVRKPIMRMIVAGHEAPDAVDKVHDAADAGDPLAAVNAIYELAQNKDRLQALRSDLVFTHRLQDKCNKPVAWHGVQVKPYDLFLQLCGVDPHQTKEAGGPDRQNETDPSGQIKAPTPQEIQKLEAEVYNPFSKPIADELNAWIWVSDAAVMGLLHKFAEAAASHSDLLRRAHQAPGPELARRIGGYNCDVRLKLQRGLDKENLVQAERILGFATDQATVGVIGGAGTLAADTKHAAVGKLPLEQALRETIIGGQVLTEIIHAKAQELADELGRWFGARADHVRSIWRGYAGTVDAKVCAQLRDQTGLPRVWAIELLANAFVQVGGGTLQAMVQQALGRDHNDVITEMGLQATDIAARKSLAETKAVQDNKNETANTAQLGAAHAQVEQAAKADSFRGPAQSLFTALTHVGFATTSEDMKRVGAQLTADLKLASIAPAASAQAAHPAAAPATAKATATVDHTPTDFASFYQKEYGIDPRRHAVEIAKTLGSAGRDAKQIGALLGVSDPSLFTAAKPSSDDGLQITEATRTLVGPDFTVNEAQTRAKKMWDLLNGNATVQLIRAQIDGRTPEEQRLIKIAFRRLSGGIDLTFYFQQQRARDQHRDAQGVSVGGAHGEVMVSGSAAETELMLEVAQHGKVSLENRISGSIASNHMDDVYAAIESASPDDRRAILANDALMNKLRKFGDDSYEWNRIYKGLAGDSDLFDRLESRAHGKHGFIGGFEGTDKAGMTSDIAGYAKERKAAIRTQVLAEKFGGKEPSDKTALDAEVNKRLKVEFQSLAENPSVRAILRDELSGTELSTREGMLQNSGEANHAASALTEHDWTEDEEKIIADIKAMTPAERKSLRENPEYIEQLRKAIQTQATWRDAMIALGSDVDGSKGTDDNYGALEKAARTSAEDTTEMFVEYNDLIQALGKLSPEEYARLQRDARLQTQILAALEHHPTQLALARQMMAFNSADAGASTGLTIADKDHPADSTKGVYTQDQVERIAFLKFGAINRLKAASTRSWAMLLQAAVAVYELKLKPSDNATPDPKAGLAGPGASNAIAETAGAAPAPKTPAAAGSHETAAAAKQQAPTTATATPAAATIDPSGGETAIENRLRHEILMAVEPTIKDATAHWGDQESTDETTHARRSINGTQQDTLITNAILHNADPSDALLMASTGRWNDDEDRIKDTIRRASDEQLIREWTTVIHHAPNGNASLSEKYTAWKAARPTDAKPGEKRAPRVGSPEWNARTAFKAFIIDTSDVFEDLLIRYSGGLGADDKKLAPGDTRIRNNNEWLEWRTLVRDKIPTLDRKKIGAAVGAAGDPEAMAILTDPTLSNTLGALAYDEEKYEVERGETSHYNMDRITAGGKGAAVDNAMGDYRREVLTSVTSTGANAGEEYGTITAEESARIGEAKDRFNKSTTEFKAAKAAVANIAAEVVAILITTVVTILTGGLAGGPLMMIMMSALAAGAASTGAQVTKKAVEGNDFELGHEGLQAIARDTVMGAVTAGATWYGSKLATHLFSMSSAVEQAAIIANIAHDQSFIRSLGKGMTEQAVQTGLTGVVDVGASAFDPALWMDGWSEGWRRGGSAARERAETIPMEMIRSAALMAITHSTRSGLGAASKALRSPAAQNEVNAEETAVANRAAQRVKENEDPAFVPENTEIDDSVKHAAFGNRASLGERAQVVGSTMMHGVGDGILMAGADVLLDERTYRAEGPSAGDIAGDFGSSISNMLKLAANTVYTTDAVAAARYRSGAKELTDHGHDLTPNEQRVYAEVVMHGSDTTVIKIAKFEEARGQEIAKAMARYDAATTGTEPNGHTEKLTSQQRADYEAWVKDARTLKEFHERLEEGPVKVVEIEGLASGATSNPADHSSSAILRTKALSDATTTCSRLEQARKHMVFQVDPVKAQKDSIAAMTRAEATVLSDSPIGPRLKELEALWQKESKFIATCRLLANEQLERVDGHIAQLHATTSDAKKNQADRNVAPEKFAALRYASKLDVPSELKMWTDNAVDLQKSIVEQQRITREIEALCKTASATQTTTSSTSAVVASRNPETSKTDRASLKDMIGKVGTPEGAKKLDEQVATEPQLPAAAAGDVVYQKIAHTLAYAEPAKFGDKENEAVRSLAASHLELGQAINGEAGLQMMTFVPDGSEPGTLPVLALRGTTPSEWNDLRDDLHPGGVGKFQLDANAALIIQTLQSLSPYGKVVLTGHSLGGALAQMIGAMHPELVSSIVTFQSPAIPKNLADRLAEHNRKAAADNEPTVESRHYAVEHDAVPLAGQQFTEGTKTLVGTTGKQPNVLSAHMGSPLEDFNSQSTVKDVPVSDRAHSETTHQVVDNLRVAIGSTVEHLSNISSGYPAPRRLVFDKVWQTLLPRIDAGMDPWAPEMRKIVDDAPISGEDKLVFYDALEVLSRPFSDARAKAQHDQYAGFYAEEVAKLGHKPQNKQEANHIDTLVEQRIFATRHAAETIKNEVTAPAAVTNTATPPAPTAVIGAIGGKPVAKIPARKLPADVKAWTVADDGRQIYQTEDHQFVDADGRVTDEFGDLIDAKGEPIDVYGRRVNHAGRLVDERNNLIDEEGRRVDTKGQLASTEPAVVKTDREKLIENFNARFPSGKAIAYRGIRMAKGTPVLGNYKGGSGEGQLVTFDLDAAMTYAYKPPFTPKGGYAAANEIVIIEFEITPDVIARDPYDSMQHVFIGQDVDITTLPGYKEHRIDATTVNDKNVYEVSGQLRNEAEQAAAQREATHAIAEGETTTDPTSKARADKVDPAVNGTPAQPDATPDERTTTQKKSNGMIAQLKAGEAVPVPKNGTAYETMKEIARATGHEVVLVRLADGAGVRMMMGVDNEIDLPAGAKLIAKVAKNGQATTFDAPGGPTMAGVPPTPARMAELLRKQTGEEKRDKALKPDITGPLATPEGKALGESLPPPPEGMIRLADGTLANGNGTPIDAYTRAWLDARKAAAAEFSGAPRNVVIDGGGPTGALAALQAFKLGNTVTLVESREEATLPILWTNRPGVMEVLMMIDPVLAKRMQAASGEVKFYDHVSPDGHNDHHAIDASSRPLDPARATGDPRKIAGESSTWTSQNKTEVELIWQRLGELADKEAASAKRAGREPRLVLKRGFDVVAMPVDGNQRGVVIQQSENRLFKVDANKQNVLDADGAPITMDYKTGDKIPPGWEKKKVEHEREDLGTPDDVLTADGAGSKGRAMAGATSVDVGPSARFIAGYFHGVGLEGTDKDGNTVQGGAKTNSEIGTDGRELHAVASSGSHLDASTWGLPEVDPNLDFKDPASIEKYFGKPMSEQDAVLLYYKTQMAKMNNRPLSDFDNITFDQLPNGMGPGGRGPSPFTLQSHVTGAMADDATNVHAMGDSGGNSHFFASLGKGTGTGAQQMAYRQYQQALDWGMDPEIASAILQRRLDAATRVWLKSGLPGFTDRSKPVPEVTDGATSTAASNETAPVTPVTPEVDPQAAARKRANDDYMAPKPQTTPGTRAPGVASATEVADLGPEIDSDHDK